jgi:predicted RND superfamily exporter protein
MSALERYARFLVRHAVAVLVLVALATAALLGGLGRLRADFDVEGSLPANHPFVQIDRRIRA